MQRISVTIQLAILVSVPKPNALYVSKYLIYDILYNTLWIYNNYTQTVMQPVSGIIFWYVFD